MTYSCERTDLAPQPIVSIRTHAAVENLPQILGENYGLLAAYLDEVGEAATGAPFVAYHSMDMANLDIEIGMPVARPLPGRDAINASEIPGGPAATCLYTGPYHEIAPAYDALAQWIADQGYEATEVAYEHYLNDPVETPPAEIQTLIVFPLKQGS